MDITVATLETDYTTLPEAITIVLSSDYTGPPGSGGGGVTDHGALTGLSDDDHTIYALADGTRGTFEVAGAVATHSADTTSVHGIADTSVLETTTGAQSKVDTHVNDTSAAHAASAVSFTPTGTIAATDVQAAIAEVASEAVGSTDLTYTASTRVVASSTGTDATLTLADGTNPGLMSSADYTKLGGVESGATADQSAAELLTAIKTVDGASSGLDADLLDGQEAAAFAAASHTHAATAVTITDSGSYYTGTDVEAALQESGLTLAALGDVTTLKKLTSGMTVPANSLDRWKAGRGLTATHLTAAINNSAATVAFVDSSIVFSTSIAQRVTIDDEEMWLSATSAGRSVTDGVTTSASTTFTSATASFVSGDAGRFIIGPGIPPQTYISSVTNGTTVVLSQAATASGTGLTVSFGATHTVTRGINGTTAASHSALAEAKISLVKHVVHVGDSIVEGTSQSTIASGDGWSVRAARMMAARLGGMIGKAWIATRSSILTQVHREFVFNGTVSLTGVADYDLGFFGALIATSGSSNGYTWTRPANERVQVVEFRYIDFGATYCAWSYSLDGGTTWVDLPTSAGTTMYSSGRGILRRVRIAADDPTSVKVRAANAAGTSKGLIIPYTPLVTYSTPPTTGQTDGVVWANLGSAGTKMRTALNSRTFTDAVVTNGSATVTSATATFVANDAGSTVYLEGVAYTISTRDSATQITLTGNYAGTTGTGKRITVFQGSNKGDRLADFIGYHASMMPDLLIIGTFVNDFGLSPSSSGDGNVNAYADMLNFIISAVKENTNVLLIAPYEMGVYDTTLQSNYRSTIESVAAAQGVASLNLYKAFDAYGYTGYTACNSAGFMADTAHLSALGNRWMGAHLARVLEIV